MPTFRLLFSGFTSPFYLQDIMWNGGVLGLSPVKPVSFKSLFNQIETEKLKKNHNKVQTVTCSWSVLAEFVLAAGIKSTAGILFFKKIFLMKCSATCFHGSIGLPWDPCSCSGKLKTYNFLKIYKKCFYNIWNGQFKSGSRRLWKRAKLEHFPLPCAASLKEALCILECPSVSLI